MVSAAERILAIDGVSRVRIIPAVPDGRSLVFGEVRHDATDALVRELHALGVAQDGEEARGEIQCNRAATCGPPRER